MAIKYRFNTEKAIEVLLYIAEKIPDVYAALKVLYFADKEHLSRYGRLICGDRYAALPYGAVPSGTYDLIKDARGDHPRQIDPAILEAFTVDGNRIIARRQANRDLLSISDMECLDAGLQYYGRRSFRQVLRLSHREAPYSDDDLEEGNFIRFEAIVRRLPQGEELLEYLNTD